MPPSSWIVSPRQPAHDTSGRSSARNARRWGLGFCLVPLLLCGCLTSRVSETPRTATEQLLLSRAVDQAMKGVDVKWLQGKKIFVEDKYFESYDKGYAVGVIRERFSRYGALITSTNDKAEVIVEIRSGSLAMNTAAFLIGIPSVGIPLPFAGTVQTPEIAFYKSEKADSIAKFALFAYSRETGGYINDSGPDSGKAHFYRYKLIGLTWKKTDIPELNSKP